MSSDFGKCDDSLAGLALKETAPPINQYSGLTLFLQLPEFCCDHFVLSPSEGAGTGDAFSRFPIAGGEYLIGDSGSSPRHVVIDAAGLKLYGVGEWHAWKHRVGRRRTWRKLHLGIDETTKEIVTVDLTESRVRDSQRFSSLLKQIPDPIGQVSGDGAYDTRAC